MPKLANLLRDARAALSGAGIENPGLDARILVEHFTETSRTDAVASPERVVTDVQVAAVHSAVARRAAGEPVHRILGFREFYGLRLALSPETLEPRPDTETLVDLVLAHIGPAGVAKPHRILDLGTGTGAIALALLSQLPHATALGVDLSADALATAARNADMCGAGRRMRALKSDWFAAVEETFDIIVSNPPYVTTAEWTMLAPEVRDFDPRPALVGGADGLEAYRVISGKALAYLAPGGLVAVEIGRGQGDGVRRLFEAGGLVFESSGHDLAGHERALLFDAGEGVE